MPDEQPDLYLSRDATELPVVSPPNVAEVLEPSVETMDGVDFVPA